MNKIVLYTVITGNYDKLKEIPQNCYFPEKIDYLCLTDSYKISDTYKIINIELIHDNHIMTQKYLKIVINKYISEYDMSIYIDGKMGLKRNILELINNMKTCEMIGFSHPKRNCIYSEAKHLIHPYKSIENKNSFIDFIQNIKNEGFPQNFGLTDNCCLIRNHNESIVYAMKEWYEICCKYSTRDQISFMYIIWKHKINILVQSKKQFNNYLKIYDHKKSRKKYENLQIIKNKYWLECFHPYENKYYYYNIKNRMCKWLLNDDDSNSIIYDKF